VPLVNVVETAGRGKGTARGVDVFTIRNGKIAEKLTYVTM
jgi:hypothetical protein